LAILTRKDDIHKAIVVVFSNVRVSGPKSRSFMALASFIIVRISSHNHNPLFISVIKVLAYTIENNKYPD